MNNDKQITMQLFSKDSNGEITLQYMGTKVCNLKIECKIYSRNSYLLVKNSINYMFMIINHMKCSNICLKK